jgi:hypothetical protein
MMLVRSLAMTAVASGLLLLETWLRGASLDVWLAGAVAVFGGVLVASLIYGRAAFLPVALGAVSALPLGWLGPTFSGWTVSVLLWLVARAVLVRTKPLAAVFLVSAVAVAVVAGACVTSAADGSVSEQIAAFLVAGVCVALPGALVAADTPVALALRQAAAAIGGSVGEMLTGAANVHASAPRKHNTWARIVRLSDARAALVHADGRKADERRAQIDAELRELTSEIVPTVPPPPPAPGEDATECPPAVAAG